MTPGARLAVLALAGAALAVGPALAAGKVAAPGREIEVRSRLYKFTYSYPPAAGRIPALRAWLDKDAAKQRSEIAREAGEDPEWTAERNGFGSSAEWQVVADLPGWLSLSGTVSSYTGGAHGNFGPIALLWDKAANRPVKSIDLFASAAALNAAIRKPFCASLDRERAERRGEPVDPKGDGPFDECLDPTKQVMILGSADHVHFTRVGVLMGPYTAGSYAEGSYEVTLPVTPAVLAAVKPQYRAAFALGR